MIGGKEGKKFFDLRNYKKRRKTQMKIVKCLVLATFLLFLILWSISTFAQSAAKMASS